MKKTNKLPASLTLKKVKILVLSPQQMGRIAAGEDSSLKPVSFDCIAPYNAPPFLTQKYCY